MFFDRAGAAALALCAVLGGCGGRSSLGVESGGAGPDAPGSSSEPRFDCRVSTSERPMLAARVGQGVTFVYPDRSTREVFTFDVPEGMYITRADVVARGDRVAAYAVTAAMGGATEPAPSAEVVVLDVDGSVLFHERRDFAYEGWGVTYGLSGNADGLFVLSLLEVKAGLGMIIDGGEAITYETRVVTLSDPDAKGRLISRDFDTSSSADLLFFDTGTVTTTPSRYLLDDPEVRASSPGVVGTTIVYLRRDPARIVYETADSLSEIPIDVKLISPGYAIPAYSASGGWMAFLLEGSPPADQRYLVTRVATGEVRSFQLSAPAGYTLPQGYWNPAPVDAQGRIVDMLMLPGAVQIGVTGDGSTWELLGRPLTENGYPMSVKEVGGAVIFDGFGDGAETPGALPAGTAQLIGPQGGEGIELVRWELGAPDNPVYADDEISGDGACVAYFRAGTVRVVETADYSASDTGLAAGGYSAEMAWIPAP